jgi:hypothetical protein
MVDIITILEGGKIGRNWAVGESIGRSRVEKFLLMLPNLLPDLFHDLFDIDLLHVVHDISSVPGRDFPPVICILWIYVFFQPSILNCLHLCCTPAAAVDAEPTHPAARRSEANVAHVKHSAPGITV